MKFLLGTDRNTQKKLYVSDTSLRTHLWGMGATGTGKTVAFHSIVRQLMCDPFNRSCFIVLDRLGGLSEDFLTWVASPYCPPFVRERFLYINVAKEDRVATFYPLNHDTHSHLFYKTARTIDCILRGSANQDVSSQPRTFYWMFNTFYSEGLLDLAISDAKHIIYPASPYHQAAMSALPPAVRAEWAEVNNARSGEALRMFEPVRNRLKPFIGCDVTSNFLGATTNRLDFSRFMREGWIVLVNLSPQERLSEQVCDALQGMMINEAQAVARSQPPEERPDTYLCLDEVQKALQGPDIQSALPELRQKKVRLLMFNQSISQLKNDAVDMTSIIFQARMRIMLASSGEDADIMAREFAAIAYDPRRIKDEMYSRRQMFKQNNIQLLCAWSEAEAQAKNWSNSYSANWTASDGTSRSKGKTHQDSDSQGTAWKFGDFANRRFTNTRGSSNGVSSTEGSTTTSSEGGGSSNSDGGSQSHTTTKGYHETLVPEYEEFLELTRRSYEDFREQEVLWAQKLRKLQTGQALVQIPNDPTIYEVDLYRHAPGYVGWQDEKLRRLYPEAFDAKEELLEKNFANREFFVTPQEIERETEARLQRILNPVIRIPAAAHPGVVIEQPRIIGNPMA